LLQEKVWALAPMSFVVAPEPAVSQGWHITGYKGLKEIVLLFPSTYLIFPGGCFS